MSKAHENHYPVWILYTTLKGFKIRSTCLKAHLNIYCECCDLLTWCLACSSCNRYSTLLLLAHLPEPRFSTLTEKKLEQNHSTWTMFRVIQLAYGFHKLRLTMRNKQQLTISHYQKFLFVNLFWNCLIFSLNKLEAG